MKISFLIDIIFTETTLSAIGGRNKNLGQTQTYFRLKLQNYVLMENKKITECINVPLE